MFVFLVLIKLSLFIGFLKFSKFCLFDLLGGGGVVYVVSQDVGDRILNVSSADETLWLVVEKAEPMW